MEKSKRNFMLGETDPQKIQHRIVCTISDEFPEVEEQKLERLVYDVYKSLARHAKVTQHIPALVEGRVRKGLKHYQYVLLGGH